VIRVAANAFAVGDRQYSRNTKGATQQAKRRNEQVARPQSVHEVRQRTIDLERLGAAQTLQGTDIGDELATDLPQGERQGVQAQAAPVEADGQFTFMLGIYIIVKSDLDVPADVGEGDEGGRDKAQTPTRPLSSL